MNAIGLSDYHEGNLRRLAAYLRGPLRAKFDMEWYGDADTVNLDLLPTTCVTVGCAVGHAPFAGVEKLRTEGWPEYSKRVFGLTSEDQWAWCFDLCWVGIDNTPVGAASRIEWLLDGHYIEKDFWDACLNYHGYKSKPVPFEVVVLRPTFAEPLEVA